MTIFDEDIPFRGEMIRLETYDRGAVDFPANRDCVLPSAKFGKYPNASPKQATSSNPMDDQCHIFVLVCRDSDYHSPAPTRHIDQVAIEQ